MAGVYVPGSPMTGALYGVVRTHLAGFDLHAAVHVAAGDRVPPEAEDFPA
jgi:hypothetical protein